jgi:predicted nucleic acid-binding protein
VTFLVDANVIVYAAIASQYRDSCLEILDAVAAGEADGKVSTAVFEEIWHLELSGRVGSVRGLAQRAYRLFTPLLPVTDDIVARAFRVEATRLGSNDRIHVATALANGIDTIVSADADFDRIRLIRRVDPLDDRARSRLLRR